MAAMGQKETKVTDLCSELAITRQTLYRHLAPDGTLRKDGLKVVEGGKIPVGKMAAVTGLTRFSVQLLLRPDFPAGFMASTTFSVSQENSIRMAAMCCLTA
jgi:hypothetical protein